MRRPLFKVPVNMHTVRREAWGLFILVLGSAVAALNYSLFQVPFNIAAGGLSGIAIIINHFTGWPQGTMFLVMNIPLMALGYFYLGRWRFLMRTLLAIAVFSPLVDLFNYYLPRWLTTFPLTNDILLNAIYAGILGGIGGGMIYRSSGTLGSTGIIGRILQQKTGTPLSQVYLYTDGVIILTAGLVFGWEIALYAFLTLFLNGLASDYTLEGPSSVRTASIITDKPELVAQALMHNLGRGVSEWQIKGAYTRAEHAMLFCTIYRPQVNDLKQVVGEVDPQAFVVIGTAHQALGYGFSPLKK